MEGFIINTAVPLEQSISALLRERITSVQEQARSSGDIHETIHETRRSIKRIRGILKMIRDEIGFSSYYRENIFYRDLARRMASSRDSYVHLQTLEAIDGEKKGLIPAPVLLTLKGIISDQLSENLDQFNRRSGGMEQLVKDISEGGERIGNYCLLRDRYISIRKGIKRTYRRGRKGQRRLHDAFDMSLFHEYRKNSKYLQFQMELLRPLSGKLIKAYAATLDKHAELLGETRDMGRLLDFIVELPAGKIPADSQSRIAKGIRRIRDRRLEAALEESSIIYAEKPGELIRRFGIYWKHLNRLHR